jgi:long-chain fatty acid transport protein
VLDRRLPFALAATVALLIVGPSASASPLIDAVGAVGGNGGAQGVVSGPSAASTYFNPAMLTEADEDLLLGFALVSEQVGVTLDGRTGGDVPLAVGSRDIVGPDGKPISNYAVPTQWLQQGCPAGSRPGDCPAPGLPARPRQSQGTSGKTRSYLAFGMVKRLIPDRLTLGLYAMLPVSGFMTAQAFYPNEREALFSNSLHPELYGDRLTAISLVLGAGFALLPELSIGAGLSVGLTSAATAGTYVSDPTNYDTLLINNALTTEVSLAPTVGLRYRPLSWLRFGGALHGPEQFALDATVNATLPSGTQSSTTRQEVFDWMPWMASLGAEGDVIQRGSYTLSVVGSLKYAFWSAYQDRQAQSPVAYGTGLAWSNTMSGVVGLRHVYGPARGFVDFSYAPSPVPEQIGRSNYVDNDRLGMALGGDLEIKVGPARLRPGLQVFGDRLIRRHNTKDDSLIVDDLPDGSVFSSTHAPVPGARGLQTNNPGWPGFASEGWIWGGALTLQAPL